MFPLPRRHPIIQSIPHQIPNEILKRRELLHVDQIELPDKIHKVFEGGVEMRLFVEVPHFHKMRVVHMRVHTKQPPENVLDNVDKVWRVALVEVFFGREEFRVVDLFVDPKHA